ncbi:hypothetical protein [Actinoplanes sp. NPDC089786]|uniref:hypothetical protein n=1 Tax=Actinoplanes sp. NPDC089786 TaxID=3155185 RepID=UPI00342D6A95
MTPYAAMAAQAQALYDQGRSAQDALRECYGVAFPGEIFAIAASGFEERGSTAELTDRPWRLLTRPVPPAPTGTDKIEEAVVRLDPDLIPLAFLTDDARHGDALVCYRVTDLTAGATTVYGLPGVLWSVPERLPDETRRLGDSLLAVLSEYFTDAYNRLEQESNRPSNRGTGAIDNDTLDEARSLVDLIESLKRQLIFGLKEPETPAG